MERRRSLKNFSFQIVKAIFALAIAVLISQFQFDYLDSLGYDLYVRLKPTPKTSGNIKTIVINKETLEVLGRFPTAGDYAKVLRIVNQGNPRSVVSLLHPNELTGNFDELKDWLEAVKETSDFFVAIEDLSSLSFGKSYVLPPPFESIKAMPGLAVPDRSVFARDGVTRRMLISYQGQLTLHPVLAKYFRSGLNSELDIQGAYPFRDSFQTFIDYRPPGTYKAVSFHEILTGDYDIDNFANKIIIIGRDTQTATRDYFKTPYSDDIVDMTAAELHANMLDTLILNSSPARSPNWFEFILTALISLLTVYVVLSLRPTSGIVALIGFVCGFTTLNFISFWTSGSWVGMTHSFLAIFICYYFFIPYRLIIENRRSWEYFQKNRLLTQVEELKSNFLSMMSHDLKTPIARIQGMLDLMKSDDSSFSKKQEEAIQTIGDSADELLEFVSSILSLNRVESKDIKLHLESRDLNEILRDVVKKHEHFAKNKEIEIVTELEPLFSTKIDVNLMKQVFSNLLENAIKYSPKGSRVLISTEETDGKLVVQVADQGVGIETEELPQIFSKFFRSQRAIQSDVKGSGLGLYLAKYFVELHQGNISVDSAINQGTTFTVELPTES